MSKAFKQIVFFLVTVALTAVLYWLIFVDSNSKQDVLEHTLALLGKKLMAMMPDTSDTQPVATLYDDFMTRAKNKEIPPEKVESLAATILNLSSLDTVISPQEAEAVIRWSLAGPVKLEKVAPETIGPLESLRVPAPDSIVPLPKSGETPLSPDQWRVIGERIRSANQFSDEYQKAIKKYRETGVVPQIQFYFRFEDDLRIAMDSTLKQQFDQRKFRQLHKHLHELERQHIIIWEKDLQKKIEREREQQRKTLQSLRQLNRMNQLERMKAIEALRNLPLLNNMMSAPSLNYCSR